MADTSGYKDGFNAVFILDTRVSSDVLAAQKENILAVSRTVFKYSPNAHIYIFIQNTDAIGSCRQIAGDGRGYFSDHAMLKSELEKVNRRSGEYIILSDGVKAVNNSCDTSRETYAFSIFDQGSVKYDVYNGREELNKARTANVKMSIIAQIDSSKKYGYAHEMYQGSGRKFDDPRNFAQDVVDYIYGRHVELVGEDDEEELYLVKSNDLEPLPEDFGELSPDSTRDYDKDGLSDAQEIDFARMSRLSSGKKSAKGFVAPKLVDLLRSLANLFDIIDRDAFESKSFDFSKCGIIMQKTDATDDDTDRDGFDDGYEVKYSDNTGASELDELSKVNKRILNAWEDEDHDGFSNGYENEGPWDWFAFNAVKANPTKVEDSTIDDSDVFEEKTKDVNDFTSEEKDNFTGYLCSDVLNISCENQHLFDSEMPHYESEYSKYALKYKRPFSAFNAKYIITPEKNSDYSISLVESKSLNITSIIIRRNNSKDILYNFHTDNMGHIFAQVELSAFVDYEIIVLVDSAKIKQIEGTDYGYTLSLEQDNWVYSPRGGVAYLTQNVDYQHITQNGDYQIYLTEDDLLALSESYGQSMETLHSKNEVVASGFVAEITTGIFGAERRMGTNKIAEAGSTASVVATFVSVVLVVVNPEPGTKVATAVAIIGDISTGVGAGGTVLSIVFNDKQCKQFEKDLYSIITDPNYDSFSTSVVFIRTPLKKKFDGFMDSFSIPYGKTPYRLSHWNGKYINKYVNDYGWTERALVAKSINPEDITKYMR